MDFGVNGATGAGHKMRPTPTQLKNKNTGTDLDTEHFRKF